MKRQYKFGTMNLKNSLIDIKGPSHSQGGVSLGNNIEVEGNEAIFGDFVFSDSLVFGGKENGKEKNKTKNKKTFADEARKIQKKFPDDNDSLAVKAREVQFKKLSQMQEKMKQQMMPQDSEVQELDPQMQSLPQDQNNLEQLPAQDKKSFKGGGDMGKSQGFDAGMIPGMGIAGAVGGLVNMGRGIFGKARQYDNVEFERAEANLVDLGEQRTSATRDSNNRLSNTKETIRNNSNSSGQLLGNSLYASARSTDDLNRVNAESYMNEENTNAQINNQVDQFNTQIGNRETMQNFNIGVQNAANRDAQQDMIFQGIEGLLGSGGQGYDDIMQRIEDRKYGRAAYGNSSYYDERNGKKRGEKKIKDPGMYEPDPYRKFT